jgi:hypothetical protein
MIGYEFHPEAEIDLEPKRLKLPSTQGHRRLDLTRRPLRFTNVRDNLIAYAPDKKPLWVVAVMHGKRGARVVAAVSLGPRVGFIVPRRAVSPGVKSAHGRHRHGPIQLLLRPRTIYAEYGKEYGPMEDDPASPTEDERD